MPRKSKTPQETPFTGVVPFEVGNETFSLQFNTAAILAFTSEFGIPLTKIDSLDFNDISIQLKLLEVASGGAITAELCASEVVPMFLTSKAIQKAVAYALWGPSWKEEVSKPEGSSTGE